MQHSGIVSYRDISAVSYRVDRFPPRPYRAIITCLRQCSYNHGAQIDSACHRYDTPHPLDDCVQTKTNITETQPSTCVHRSESNVVSLAAQQQCSRFNQKASRHTPSFKSDIHVAPISTTAAHTPVIQQWHLDDSVQLTKKYHVSLITLDQNL